MSHQAGASGGFAVILVFSTSHALRAESIIEAEGVRCKLIPVPRQLSSDCGVCVRVDQGDKERALRLLAEAGLEIDGVHDIG